MSKQTKPKSQLQVRAALRASEERRLDHAVEVLIGLLAKHDPEGRDASDLLNMQARLKTAIKNQHITDERYAKYKTTQGIDTSVIQGY